MLFLVSASALLVSCARALPPRTSYPLAFSIDVRAPRVLAASQEIAVPVTVANTGVRAWDATRVHVSYHWLWLVPRELIKRSRSDCRTTTASAPSSDGTVLAPGARVALQGRILAPALPGLYWLQWDMVEEGVTWFAQVCAASATDARDRAADAGVVVRAVAAADRAVGTMLGRFGASRGRRPGPRRDRICGCLWCAAALAAKPLILIDEALLEPTAVAYWLIVIAAVVPPALGVCSCCRDACGRGRCWRSACFGSTLILADVFYYRFFGDVLSAPAVLAARQTGRVWGTIRSVLTPDLLWLIVDLAARDLARSSACRAAHGAARHRPVRGRPRSWPRLTRLLCCRCSPLGARQVLASTPLDQMFRDRARWWSSSDRSGTTPTTSGTTRTAPWLRPPATEAAVHDARVVVRRARSRCAPAAAPGFGAARGKNLIVVQVESLQEFAVDFQVAGQEVMPHLREWCATACGSRT